MIPIDEEKVQQMIKKHLDSSVKSCLRRSYQTGQLGYLVVVGGSALNHYLSGYEEITTSDYDLKFVVMPQFTDDPTNLRRANVKRLYLTSDLVKCLSSSPNTPDFKIKVKLMVNDRQQLKQIKIDGSRAMIVDPETEQERPFVYNFNKTFKVILRYQFKDSNKRLRTSSDKESQSKASQSKSKIVMDQDDQSDSDHSRPTSHKSPSYKKLTGGDAMPKEKTNQTEEQIRAQNLRDGFDPDSPVYDYEFIDIGMFYRIPQSEPFYNFMTNQMYDTMLKEPFNQKVPIPFQVADGIRYPVFPYLLMDNFRMLHFAQDFLSVNIDDPVKIEFGKKKIAGYQKKLNIILDYLQERHGKEAINKIATEIKASLKLYEPLAMPNSICYREEGRNNYVTKFQDKKPECTPEYINKLDAFYEQYHRAFKEINKLMPAYHPNRKVSKKFIDTDIDRVED